MELLGHRIGVFYLQETTRLFYLSDSTILHSHQQCTRVPVAPHLVWIHTVSLASFSLVDMQWHFFLNKFYLHIYLFILAVLGLCCCVRAFSSCGERELLFVAVCGLLIAVASLVAEHGL